jgi:alpha-ketoglutarate-dependent taurine dioxygenase
MEEFPWHTDCSYENPTPRYFALQVLQHDRCGGGVLSVMSVARLVSLLSEATREALAKPDFRIEIPPEFIKNTEGQCIVGSVLSSHDAIGGGGRTTYGMRFRDDILRPLTGTGAAAVLELRQALQRARGASDATLHLESERDMPRGSVLLVDNRRWLHARNEVRDNDRHLRRIRWDAVQF